jgi:hypothetical protein
LFDREKNPKSKGKKGKNKEETTTSEYKKEGKGVVCQAVTNSVCKVIHFSIV